MAEKDTELDQLWYTWSANGLGSMPMGFRVRAASEALYNIQGMRYRLVDRFLRYEPPKGVSPNGFNQRSAPITLAFIHNGEERLLVRKVFKGQDLVGRNGSFFAHLIAGLPASFTARDAIRLWICPKLWVDSEQDKAYNDTYLPKMHYYELEEYVRQSQTRFNFAPISEQLKSILLVILSQGVPPRLYLRGQSIFTAALIYGITHCLPMTMLNNLTFTTYESEIDGFEATILGTLSAEDMAGEVTLRMNPAAPSASVSSDIQKYVSTVVDCLLENNTTKINRMLDLAEKSEYATTDLLIGLYNRRFRSTPLTLEQLESIVYYPDASIDELLDPATPQEGVDLLLREVDYWRRRGKQFFSQVVSGTIPNRQISSQEAREALTTFFQKMGAQVLVSLEKEISQGTLPSHSLDVLQTLAPLDRDGEMCRSMIIEFPKKPGIEDKFTSEALWPFRESMIQFALLLQPTPTLEQIWPWLRTGAWDKLGRLLKLNLPLQWEQSIIVHLLERMKGEVPKAAISIIQVYEAKFKTVLQLLLQNGYQKNETAHTETVMRFFTGLVEREYQDRMIVAEQSEQANAARILLLRFLSFLLNVSPKEPSIIERLFASVSLTTAYRLTDNEIDWILIGCPSEVIAACGDAPTLLAYLRQWLLLLTPASISSESTQNLLGLLSSQSLLPVEIKELVINWMTIFTFQRLAKIDRGSLEDIKQVLQHLLPDKQVGQEKQQQRLHPTEQDTQEADSLRHQFVSEMIHILVRQTKTEPDLELVLEIMGEFLLESRWDLLSHMASLASLNYARDVSRLTPYLLRGIYEYEQFRNRNSQRLLDNYLQILYHTVDEVDIKDVDTNSKLKTWSPEVRLLWQDWRRRMNASKQRNIASSTNRASSTQQQLRQYASPANPNPATLQGPNNAPAPLVQPLPQIIPAQLAFAGTQSGEQPESQASEYTVPAVPYVDHNALPTQPAGHPQQPLVLSNQSGAATPPVQPFGASELGSAAGQQSRTVATIVKPSSSISFEKYQWIYQRILPVLKYWSLVYARKRDQAGSKSAKFEARILEALLKDLQKPEAPNIVLRKLVEYLVDDILIEYEMDQLVASGTSNQWFDINSLTNGKTIIDRLGEMKASAGLAFAPQPDEDIKVILRIFMRRDLFIQYLDQHTKGNELMKNKMESWLDNKRKEAKIHIGYS